MDLCSTVALVTAVAEEQLSGKWVCVRRQGLITYYWEEEAQEWLTYAVGTVYTSQNDAENANPQGFAQKIYD